MLSLTRGAVAGLLLGSWMVYAAAQSIYTCTDGKGHKLNADRPIAECTDREQKELNPSGTVRRKVGPSLTAQERAAQEAQGKLALEEQARQLEEKRRDRALLIRYPNQSVHDKERVEALTQVDEVIKAAQKRVGELEAQRQNIEAEFEFYKKDPSRAPSSLKRQVEDNARSVAVQNRFIAEQEAEKKRINTRFDEELGKLKQLWLLQAPAAKAPELGRPVPKPAAR